MLSPLMSRTAMPVGSLPASTVGIVTKPPLPLFKKIEISWLPWLRTTRSVKPSLVRYTARTWVGSIPVE